MTGIRTPPGTTLSTPSPTERQEADLESEMAAKQAPVYLIVATSFKPPLGIGFRGSLPWRIASDMAFFKRATLGDGLTSDSNKGGNLNKVIMGRKTWDSIPQKFRPLKGRINVVVTRSDAKSLANKIQVELNSKSTGSTSEAFELDCTMNQNVVGIKQSTSKTLSVAVTDGIRAAVNIEAHDTFCIGGAEIYSLLLKDPILRSRLRILQTQVKKEDDSAFECDTFWPEKLENGKDGWQEVSSNTLKSWIQTDIPQGSEEWFKDEKAKAQIRVKGWEQEQK